MKSILPLLIFVTLTISCSRQREREIFLLSEELVISDPVEKIWAHRVNSLDGLEERVKEFRGVEVDIFYIHQKNIFEVKHDPDSTGIELEFYLDSLMHIKEVLLWLDYKNLTDHTAEGVAALDSILMERGLENVAFVESYNAMELEQFFGKIATSHWVTSIQIPDNKNERDMLYREKYAYINSLNVNMLSASYEMFEFLAEYFPHFRCNFWMSGVLSEEKKSILVKMAETDNVNVILIDGNRNFLR